jgi:hypothetical protein
VTVTVASVRPTVKLLMTTLPFAALPLTVSPLPVTLGLVPIRRSPRTFVDLHGRSLVDRTSLNVDRLGSDERMRQRRRHENRQARQTDRDVYIGSGLRDRCGA